MLCFLEKFVCRFWLCYFKWWNISTFEVKSFLEPKITKIANFEWRKTYRWKNNESYFLQVYCYKVIYLNSKHVKLFENVVQSAFNFFSVLKSDTEGATKRYTKFRFFVQLLNSNYHHNFKTVDLLVHIYLDQRVFGLILFNAFLLISAICCQIHHAQVNGENFM